MYIVLLYHTSYLKEKTHSNNVCVIKDEEEKSYGAILG